MQYIQHLNPKKGLKTNDKKTYSFLSSFLIPPYFTSISLAFKISMLFGGFCYIFYIWGLNSQQLQKYLLSNTCQYIDTVNKNIIIE